MPQTHNMFPLKLTDEESEEGDADRTLMPDVWAGIPVFYLKSSLTPVQTLQFISGKSQPNECIYNALQLSGSFWFCQYMLPVENKMTQH